MSFTLDQQLAWCASEIKRLQRLLAEGNIKGPWAQRSLDMMQAISETITQARRAQTMTSELTGRRIDEAQDVGQR